MFVHQMVQVSPYWSNVHSFRGAQVLAAKTWAP
jgi:hypothetical protein